MSTNDSNSIDDSVDGSRSLRITCRESSPEESIAALRECFEDGLEKLTERERAIAEMRFGLSDGKHHPFEEIMETFDITKDEIKSCFDSVKTLLISSARRNSGTFWNDLFFL